jgi:Kef-type K+ transport system membrane component KefB
MQTMSTIGILILLFLAGLEIDLETMRRMGFAAFLVAVMGVLVPLGVGTAVFALMGEGLTSAFFVGSIMTATSIGLTLRTLMDLGRFRSKEGVTIVTAAVIDDVIGIFILTLLVSLVGVENTLTPFYVLRLLGLMIFFFGAVIIVGMWGSKWVTRWVSEMWVDEALLALSLCFAIALGWLASTVKVAEITGAFVAGLVLNPTKEAKVVSEKVNLIGYGFFIPIFFAYLGVNTRLAALSEAGILTLLFLLIAVAGKIAGCGLAARPWFDSRRSLAIGVGMIPRAEVALIMASIGLQAGAIGDDIFAMTVAMVFITNLITPLLLKASFRLAEERKVRGEEAEETST